MIIGFLPGPVNLCYFLKNFIIVPKVGVKIGNMVLKQVKLSFVNWQSQSRKNREKILFFGVENFTFFIFTP